MRTLLFVLLGTALAAGADGTLRVRSDVPGVKVLIDDQEAGETPATIERVAPGKHRLTLIKPGYEDHTEDIDVKDGATLRPFVVMKASSASLPAFPIQYRALHQHRSGACVGELTLEADGVKFRATDGQDNFTLPLKEIKSVARSAGGVPFGFGIIEDSIIASKMRAKILPARIEAPGRSYGFWATDTANKETDPDKLDEVARGKTKELFETMYQLWSSQPKK